jgi:predicted nucleotidyltransferase
VTKPLARGSGEGLSYARRIDLACSISRTYVRKIKQVFAYSNKRIVMGLLRSPLDEILGNRTKIKLLRVLVPLSRPVSLREAARLAGMSAAGASRAMEHLTAMGVMERREASGQHLYTVNRENYFTGVLSGLFGAEEARQQALFQALRDALVPMAKAAAIFGSRARGDDRPDSDLDLLVVIEDADGEEGVWDHLVVLQPRIQREFGLRLSPVILGLERLREREREGDPFVEAVAAEGIPIIKPSIQKLIHGEARKA